MVRARSTARLNTKVAKDKVAQAVEVTISAVPVGTTAPGDFTQNGTVLTIPAGEKAGTGTVTISAVNDDVDGPDKNLVVRGAVTVVGMPDSGLVAFPFDEGLTIRDDDGPLGVELRLVDGTGTHEGRLEMRYRGEWGTVCDDYWTDVEAGVVCRLLDYELGPVDGMGRTRDAQGRSLPPSFGPTPAGMRMWLDNVNCRGDETSLLDCPRQRSPAVGVHNCRAHEAVGVQCRVRPQVESVAVSPASGPYTGGTLRVTVQWDQAVVVTTPAGGSAPKLVVGYDTGGVTSERDAVYASGTGTAALVFEHTLAGGSSFDSVEVVSDEVQLRDGAIVWKTDQGVNAALALAPMTNNQVEAPVVVAVPVVEGAPAVGEAGDDGAWTAGETVEVRLTFSDAVTVDTADGTPSIGLLLGGGQSRRAAYASGTGTAELVFEYTLAEGEGPYNAMLVPGDSLALNGGAIVSTADSTVDCGSRARRGRRGGAAGAAGVGA